MGKHMSKREKFGNWFRHLFLPSHYDVEVGGYVHDTAMTMFIPPTAMHGTVATWTQVAGQTTDTIALHGDATDESAFVTIPIILPSNGAAGKGSYLKSIGVDYEVWVAACDGVIFTLNKVTRGADGADATVTAVTITMDSGHDTSAEADDLDEHNALATLTTPVWIDDGDYFLFEIEFNKAATTQIDMLGAFANYTFRV